MDTLKAKIDEKEIAKCTGLDPAVVKTIVSKILNDGEKKRLETVNARHCPESQKHSAYRRVMANALTVAGRNCACYEIPVEEAKAE